MRNLYAIHLEIRKEGAGEAKLQMYNAAAKQIRGRHVLIKRCRIKKDGNLEYDYAGFNEVPGSDYAVNAMALDILFSASEEETITLDTALLQTIAETRKQFAGELYAVGVTVYTKSTQTDPSYEPGFRLDHCFAFEDAHAVGYEYLGINELSEQYGYEAASVLLDEFKQ